MPIYIAQSGSSAVDLRKYTCLISILEVIGRQTEVRVWPVLMAVAVMPLPFFFFLKTLFQRKLSLLLTFFLTVFMMYIHCLGFSP